jgi:hypothetical protein
MIHLQRDCLVFKMPNGESIPCSSKSVSIELTGEAAQFIDKHIVEQAAAAVLHYFKVELGRLTVSIDEFAQALGKALNAFGLSVASAQVEPPKPRIAEADLRLLACESGKGFELVFFPRLREEVRRNLDAGPRVLCFRGLRGCVKQLIGARRWSMRCQSLNDQIVEYLRGCLTNQKTAAPCALVVV